jgi:hypothetical protein
LVSQTCTGEDRLKKKECTIRFVILLLNLPASVVLS